MPYAGMHQESPIARKQSTVVSFHDLQQESIFGFLYVKRVKSQKTKVTRQFAQMPVSDKAMEAPSLQPRSRRKNIRSDRIPVNVEAERSLNLPAEINGNRTLFGRGHDEIDLRMWNPASLDNVLDSCLLAQFANNRKFPAQARRNEDVRQIPVKPQLYFKVHGVDLCNAPLLSL